MVTLSDDLKDLLQSALGTPEAKNELVAAIQAGGDNTVINGESGPDITIAAGTGISVGTSSNTITITNTVSAPSGSDTQVGVFHSTTLQGQSNLVYDYTNNRLGINQATPIAALHMGSGTTSGTVGANASILGIANTTANIGQGALIIGGSTFGTNTASGSNSLAGGNLNIASGNRSVALGFTNTSSGSASFSIGATNLASGAFSASLGEGTISQAYGSLALGLFNIAQGTTFPRTAGDQIFIVGNGVDSSNRATAFFITSDANADLDGTLTIENLIIDTPQTPASASATGTAGTIAWDSDYIYVCIATDTWKRVAIATW